MGLYLNPGSDKFQEARNSAIYVDKSGLIGKLNQLIKTKAKYVCISRPRRFGKTLALEMLEAYYGIGENAAVLFEDLKVSAHSTFQKHLNQYNVIAINMQNFLSKAKSVEEMIDLLCTKVTKELVKAHPDVEFEELHDFNQVMSDVYQATKRPFIILIDEWDCLFRLYQEEIDAHEQYLDFLRLWLKDQPYVGLAYMTGILPIKKYKTHSALNMFDESSMTAPDKFVGDFGFTQPEVLALCQSHNQSFEGIREWYNGYFADLKIPIYNPKSVSKALDTGKLMSYWTKTETYEALQVYIRMDYDGLQDKIVRLIAGEAVKVNPDKFGNDMKHFKSADDVLTLLVHLGYLSFDYEKSTVTIPNKEIRKEFINAIEDLKEWGGTVALIQNSEKLLQAIFRKDEKEVAKLIEKVHEKHVSLLQYNDENALSYVIGLALYAANDYYTVIRELPTGKGFADLVFMPRKQFPEMPALLVELKWDKDAKGAISQIKEKNYLSALEGYRENLLLVGINYDKKTKKHQCSIENPMK